MNEKTREFERASHIDVYALGKDRAKWEQTLDKFTELIVQDIRKIIDDAYHYYPSEHVGPMLYIDEEIRRRYKIKG